MNEERSAFRLIGIAMEMGYLVALPLVLFAAAGAFLDRVLGTKPLILLISVLFAIIISTILVYRKTKEMIDESERK